MMEIASLCHFSNHLAEGRWPNIIDRRITSSLFTRSQARLSASVRSSSIAHWIAWRLSISSDMVAQRLFQRSSSRFGQFAVLSWQASPKLFPCAFVTSSAVRALLRTSEEEREATKRGEKAKQENLLHVMRGLPAFVSQYSSMLSSSSELVSSLSCSWPTPLHIMAACESAAGTWHCGRVALATRRGRDAACERDGSPHSARCYPSRKDVLQGCYQDKCVFACRQNLLVIEKTAGGESMEMCCSFDVGTLEPTKK